MRDVNFGWVLRYSHANGALYSLSSYMHIFTRISLGSYFRRELLWCSGV